MYHVPQQIPCCNHGPIMANPCGGDPCSTQLVASEYVKYVGPNLPCTNILTCDTLTVSLQKIDEQICNLKNTVVSLQNQINALKATTTTTTTTIIL